MTIPNTRLVMSAALALALAACAAPGNQSTNISTDSTPKPIPLASAGDEAGLQNWMRNFRGRALSSGISGSTYDRAMAIVRYNPDVIRLDRRQAEFSKPVWEYLDSAASADRISNGRQNLAKFNSTLNAIEARYGVEKEVVLAVWGMESNYGKNRGRTQIIPALATLAYDGRRGEMFSKQLIAALQIIQAGDIDPAHMLGSWAGAMGHTQFMPTSFLSYAVDFTGDGRRDIWSDDPTDSLASTAAYLKRSGWQKGMPWAVEVQLPSNFNYGQASRKNVKSASSWQSMGVRTLGGGSLPNLSGAILAPAGARGPAFLVTRNFNAIRAYNASDSYVMGVGTLSDQIAGRPGIRGAWPRNDSPLSSAQKSEIQRRLTQLGFDTGGVDGKLGSQSLEAIKAFQASRGMQADGYANEALLKALRR